MHLCQQENSMRFVFCFVTFTCLTYTRVSDWSLCISERVCNSRSMSASQCWLTVILFALHSLKHLTNVFLQQKIIILLSFCTVRSISITEFFNEKLIPKTHHIELFHHIVWLLIIDYLTTMTRKKLLYLWLFHDGFSMRSVQFWSVRYGKESLRPMGKSCVINNCTTRIVRERQIYFLSYCFQ
jgi:hypothetical protein